MVFFDLRPQFKLTDVTQRLPCNRDLWKCRSAPGWIEARKMIPDSQTRWLDAFLTEIRVLSIYADERASLEHIQSSQRLRSLMGYEPINGSQEQDTCSVRRSLLSSDGSKHGVAFSDAIVHDAIMFHFATDPGRDGNGQSPIVHVIAILREIPLRTIYTAVGWEAYGTEMQRSRKTLQEYLQCNQSVARTCLWHAAQIYAASRNCRCFTYSSPLSFIVAVSYILLYDQIVPHPTLEGNVLRLDKVGAKNLDLEAWKSCAKNLAVHITGVGALDGTKTSRRLLVDAEKTLRYQKPWRTLTQGLAQCLSQMSKGQRPHFN